MFTHTVKSYHAPDRRDEGVITEGELGGPRDRREENSLSSGGHPPVQQGNRKRLIWLKGKLRETRQGEEMNQGFLRTEGKRAWFKVGGQARPYAPEPPTNTRKLAGETQLAAWIN